MPHISCITLSSSFELYIILYVAWIANETTRLFAPVNSDIYICDGGGGVPLFLIVLAQETKGLHVNDSTLEQTCDKRKRK